MYLYVYTIQEYTYKICVHKLRIHIEREREGERERALPASIWQSSSNLLLIIATHSRWQLKCCEPFVERVFTPMWKSIHCFPPQCAELQANCLVSSPPPAASTHDMCETNRTCKAFLLSRPPMSPRHTTHGLSHGSQSDITGAWRKISPSWTDQYGVREVNSHHPQ